VIRAKGGEGLAVVDEFTQVRLVYQGGSFGNEPFFLVGCRMKCVVDQGGGSTPFQDESHK
jgi:hypothetical protein